MANKQRECPHCRSTNIAEIAYGLLAYDEELEEQLASGKIVLGGCCISDNDPKYHCNQCGEDFGYPEELENFDKK